MSQSTQPAWISREYAPVADEIEAFDLPVAGHLAPAPAELPAIATPSTAASELVVLDASNLAALPVAAVALPRGVPAGFHGSWIANPA